MWPKRAHVISPHSDESVKKTFHCTDEMDKAFLWMKAIISLDALVAYPNHNIPFHIFTDASDYQMGAVIMQDEKPVAYWSRNLHSEQRIYTTMEKEILYIIMVLKEFITMLLGSELHIHTDHKT